MDLHVNEKQICYTLRKETKGGLYMNRFGIIGTSKITEQFIEATQFVDDVEVVAVYSRNVDTGNAYAAKHNLTFVHTDLTEMANNPSIDAVYIASPNAYHKTHAIQMMQAGKHVLVEKPIASNVAEVTDMIQTAKENQVLLMEAMKSTVQPGFDILRANIAKLGPIRKYIASYCQYSSRYDAFKQGEVMNAFKPELSNGALMDIGVYTLHPLVQLFGEPTSVLAKATMLLKAGGGIASRHTSPNQIGVDGAGSIVLGYEGMEAVVVYSKIANSYLPSEIQGEHAVLLMDQINEPREIKIIDRTGKVEVIAIDNVQHGMMHEVAHFVDCIKTGLSESPINAHVASLGVMRIMDEVRKQIGLSFPADEIR
jgi:predicted dehydrogenase